MSFKKYKRECIKKYMMEKIFKEKTKDFKNDTIKTFNISQTTIYRYLKELEFEGEIAKNKDGKWELVKKVNELYSYSLKGEVLHEDLVFDETLSPYVQNLAPNVRKIWEYAFTEMFNNVIDHSEAKTVKVSVEQNSLYTWVNIADDGVGIFNKITKYFKYSSLDEAISSLFKGKFTTDKENHTGEGIFFTSKLMDRFYARSSNKLFAQVNTSEKIIDLKDMESFKDKRGTLIIMVLTNDTNQELKEVFDMYSDDDGGFAITKIPMDHVCDNGYPVSRSQAKRLYFGFEKFEKVILDFKGVEEMGQGFAHELFNVFAKKHPDIDLEPINTNPNIDKMIYRVKQ